ncbi:hypothetical protein D3C76_877770 [compost metagenome]
MLGLREQVGRDVGGLGGIVGEHDDFARSGDAVDIDSAVDLAFGQGHVDVPWPADLIDRRDGRRAEGQCGDRLRAAHAVDLVHAGFSGGHENVRIDALRAAGRRRSDHHDLRHSGDLSRNHVHQHRGRVCRLAAGNIDAHTLQRADDLAEDRTVRLQIHPGIAFLPGMKRPDIGCGGADRRYKRLLNPAICGLKLSLRHTQLGSRKRRTVKTFRITEQCRVTFFFDIGHNFLHSLVLLRRSVLHFTLKLKFLARLNLHRCFPLLLLSALLRPLPVPAR